MSIVLLEALTFGLGHLVRAADAAGERLCLLTGVRPLYQHELAQLPADAIDVVDVDTQDIAACARILKELPDLHGLINSTDTWAVPGAELAEQFGLPGRPVASARFLRDKLQVRNRLHSHGLSRSPGYADPAQVTLPAVVKDSAGTSSRNVWLVRTPAELEQALAEADQGDLKGTLFAEQLFPGPVYSAETITWDGQTKVLGVLSRQVSGVREDAAAFPVAFPAADAEMLAFWVSSVLSVAGFDQGFAHVEFVLTVDGPELVEINGRIGGALVGEALCRNLGTNVYSAMIEMALGREPGLLTSPGGNGPGVAFALVYPAERGVLHGIGGLDQLGAYPGDPEWYPTMSVGDRVEHLDDQRGCVGIVLAQGPTAELALHRALTVAAVLRPEVRPARK